MATAVQDALDLIAADWRPSSTQARAAIYAAVTRAAAEGDGIVTVATIRPHLPEHVKGSPMIGATVTALVRQHVLVWTGRFALSGNTAQRNGLRPTKEYRLAQPVPEALP